MSSLQKKNANIWGKLISITVSFYVCALHSDFPIIQHWFILVLNLQVSTTFPIFHHCPKFSQEVAHNSAVLLANHF